MPKIKSSSAAGKRFRPTSNGRFKHKQSHLRHILTKKGSKSKRQLRALHVVEDADTPLVQRMLPYAR